MTIARVGVNVDELWVDRIATDKIMVDCGVGGVEDFAGVGGWRCDVD